MAEASPFDNFWGIMLGINEPEAEHPSNWKRRNIMGEILTDVRQRLWEKRSEVGTYICIYCPMQSFLFSFQFDLFGYHPHQLREKSTSHCVFYNSCQTDNKWPMPSYKLVLKILSTQITLRGFPAI